MNVIKDCRKRLGLNQHDFASLIGVHAMSISVWENSGKPPVLTAERLCRLIMKRKFLPRPDQVEGWLRIEGGQVALERLIDGARDRGREVPNDQVHN